MAVTLNSNYQLVASKNTSTYSTLRLYAKLNSQNVGNNTSNITLQARLYGNGGAGSFSSGSIKTTTTENNSTTSLGNTSYKKGSETTLKTWTTNVSHSSDGNYTNKTITAVLTSTASPNGTASGTITIPQIKRASVLNKPSDFTFSTNANLIQITYTEYVGSYTADLYMKINGNTFATRTNISSGSYVTFTSGELNSAYGLAPNTSTPTVTFELVTKNGSTQIGNTSIQTAVGTISSSLQPSITSVSLSDYYGYSTTYGSYIQGKSKVNVSINASGSSGASVTGYSTTINGQTIPGQSFTTNTISSSGTNYYSVTITDSRGRTATTTGNYSVLAYSDPTISDFRIARCDSNGVETNEGNYVKINSTATITSLNNVNSKNFKVEYKLHSASTWTTLLTYNSSYTYTLTDSIHSGFSSSNAYDLRLVAYDNFSSQTALYELPTAKAVLDFYKDGTGIAIGKVAQTSNLFEVGYNAQINGNLVVNGTSQILNGLYCRPTGQAGTPVGNSMLVIKRVTNSEAPNNGVVLEFGNSTNWVGQLYIGDNATQGIYYNGWSNGTRGSWRRLADAPVNLYNDASGTTGNVVLSETSANFSYIEIYYKTDDEYYSQKVYSPNGKAVTLLAQTLNTSTPRIFGKTKNVTISGTSISVNNYCQYTINNNATGYLQTSSDRNTIYIVRVDGYR